MKKIASYLLACLIAVYSMGNVAPPKAYISEVFFDGSGNWTIELGFYDAYPLAEIDSIFIESSSGSSKVAFCSLVPGSGWPGFDSLAIITIANLIYPVTINPQHDYIKVTNYMFGYSYPDYLPLGNYPGSLLDCRQNTESIVYNALWYQTQYIKGFCIDKSPTIGTSNDTTGAMASYSGNVYDSSGNLFPEGLLYIPHRQDIILYVHADGSFSERVFAKRYTFDTIIFYLPPYPQTILNYTVAPVDFCISPDSAFFGDIITTGLLTDIPDQPKGHKNPVIVSPNPFNDIVTFFFLPEPGMQLRGMHLSLFGHDGRLMETQDIEAGQQKWEWVPGKKVPSGFILYRLTYNHRIIAYGKLVKL